ncbi:MAG: Ger(x)C family spore germination protein [Paenibacillus sp.]|nr:Ger(x)C family spore germination protein [Paenibacillus sp.]
MKVKWIIRIIIYLGLLSLLTSCLQGRELNELAIVTGIAIDKVKGSDEFLITFQVVNPSSTATTTGGGSGESTITTYSSTDRTIFGALRKTSRKASRQLFFAHTQLVIVGENLARGGIEEIFDIFERSHELRLTSSVIISRDTDAASILQVFVPIENLPAVGLAKKSRNTSALWGESRDVKVFELINTVSGGGDLSISGVQIVGDAEEGMKKTNLEQSEVKASVEMNGIGVFKDGKLQGWIEGAEARGAVWVQNKLKETSVNINTEKDKKAIAINIVLSKTRIKVDLQDGVPVFHIFIKEEGKVDETQGFVDFSKREEIVKLEKMLEEKTKAEVIEALKATQRMKSDIFKFGMEMKRTQPEAWAKVSGNWHDIFALGKLDVQVEAYILSTGMRLKPYVLEKE